MCAHIYNALSLSLPLNLFIFLSLSTYSPLHISFSLSLSLSLSLNLLVLYLSLSLSNSHANRCMHRIEREVEVNLAPPLSLFQVWPPNFWGVLHRQTNIRLYICLLFQKLFSMFHHLLHFHDNLISSKLKSSLFWLFQQIWQNCWKTFPRRNYRWTPIQ